MVDRSRKLLHIDDDEPFTRLMAHRLGQHGYQLDAFHDPMLALAELANDQHRVVLLDINMPGVNGLELLRQIKRRDGSIQVIMLTAHVGVDVILQSLRWGAEGCFFKPVTDIHPLLECLDLTFRKLDRWQEAISEMNSAPAASSTAGRNLPDRE